MRRLTIGMLACALPLAAVPAASAAPASAPAPTPVCAGASRPNPIAVTLTGVRAGYAAGGGWSVLHLTLRNRSGAACGELRPVLVYGARNHTLRADAVHLQAREAGHWHALALAPALGELAAGVGPAHGLRLTPRGTVTLTLRMRIARTAPHGEWLSLAVAYAPLPNHPTTEAWPVGVTNPAYFRVR